MTAVDTRRPFAYALDHPLAEGIITGGGVNSCDQLPNLMAAHQDGSVDRDALRALAPYAWKMADAPLLAVTRKASVDLFRAAGFLSDDARYPEPPTGGLELWRGCYPAARRGMAWTTDPERAAWFAHNSDLAAFRLCPQSAPGQSSLCRR